MKRKANWNVILSVFISIIGIIGFKSRLFLDKAYCQDMKLEEKQIKEGTLPFISKDNESVGKVKRQINAQLKTNVDTLPVIALTLKDVTDLAINNSIDIQLAQFDAYIKRTSLMKEESIFDTFLNAETSFIHDKSERASSLLGTDSKENKLSIGIEKKLPSGTTVSLEATDTKYRTDSLYNTLNPYHEGAVELSIIQELGKNFFGLADRSKIKLTKIDIENSDFTSLDSIENSLYTVQRSYWNFVLKEKNLSIAREMLNEARKLCQIYNDKYPLGLVEESDLLAVEALLHARESEVDIALLEKETAKNDLLFLINQGDFEQGIASKDSLDCTVDTVDLYEALRKATQHRRDYKKIKNETEKNKIDLVVKKNALWPEIDLEASFTRNNLNTAHTRAWEDIMENSNDEVSFKISLRLPLENREARSELEKAKLEKTRYLLMLKRVERLILQEVNDKINQVNTMQNQVRLFETTVGIHQKKLAEQIKRLNYGRSDSDTLIRYEEDLLAARLSLAYYLFRYRISLIELDLVQNSLLDKYWKEPL